MPVTDHEPEEAQAAFVRAIVAGLDDLDSWRDLSLDEARERLGVAWQQPLAQEDES